MESDEPDDREARESKEAAKWKQAEEVAARVRAVRGFRGYSQGELSELTGLSRQYVSELEQGKRPRPRGETLERLAAALGVTADQLRGCAPLTTGPRPAPSPEEEQTPPASPSAEVEMWHTTLRDGSLVIQIRTNGLASGARPGARPPRRRRLRPRRPRQE